MRKRFLKGIAACLAITVTMLDVQNPVWATENWEASGSAEYGDLQTSDTWLQTYKLRTRKLQIPRL